MPRYPPSSTRHGAELLGPGFRPGHNCPSADRTSSVENSLATFFVTNMMPQAPQNNQQTWANPKNYTRTFLAGGNEVYIVCGSRGTGSAGGLTTILDQGRVTVPNRCSKVVVMAPVGDNGVARVNAGMRAIDRLNVNSISTDWGTYRTTVDATEAPTGLGLPTCRWQYRPPWS